MLGGGDTRGGSAACSLKSWMRDGHGERRELPRCVLRAVVESSLGKDTC